MLDNNANADDFEEDAIMEDDDDDEYITEESEDNQEEDDVGTELVPTNVGRVARHRTGQTTSPDVSAREPGPEV